MMQNNRRFAAEEAQFQFEIDVLGSFLASNAFPDGARPSFTQPVQDQLNSLEPEVQANTILNLPITEAKLRCLLGALQLCPETLLGLAQTVKEEATAHMIIELCASHHETLTTCLSRFDSKSIINAVTTKAVAEETFIELLVMAQRNDFLFEQTWLDMLFQNRHLPIKAMIPYLLDLNLK